jgi:UDP-glucose 4-epimerase
MRILVTGGAGFIGSHVAEAFIAGGHEVAIVDDLSSGHNDNVPAGVTLYECDIRDTGLEDVFAKVRPEVVSHHAAQISVQASIDEPRLDASINVEGSVNLLECARAAGVRKVLYASTGGALYGEPGYLPCDEEHPIAPLSHYGVSKYVMELYLSLYQRLYGLDYTILRYPNVYGPRQDPHGEAGVVAIFIGRMLSGEPVTIYGDGEQTRDFVYVGDIARASIAALTEASGASINLGSNRGSSINEVFQTLAAITDYRHEANYAPPRRGDIYQIALTGSRAKEMLAWEPSVSLLQGLEETVASVTRASESAPRTDS